MYTWKGMLKISKEEAIKKYSETDVYLLRNDNSEALAEDICDIINHNEEFGIELEK